MSILIVDDSDIVRIVVKKSLELYGYNDVVEGKDGVSAFEIIKEKGREIELFVFDVNMPRMDGITLVEKVRALGIQKPIIMLTTETDKEKMLKAKMLGATGWIIKPFDSEKFIRVMEMFVKKP